MDKKELEKLVFKNDMINEGRNVFSLKWVEKTFVWGLSIAGAIVISAIIYSVIKK